MAIHRISILGVGLLGGSLGLASRVCLNDVEIVGYGHRPSTLERALACGAIQRAEPEPDVAVRGADLVVLCTPVGVFEGLMTQIGGSLKPGAIVTDVGSTKRTIVRLAERLLPAGVHFVGSHPMAGSEKRGVEYARADLFRGATCILTPTPRTDAGALETVEYFWQCLAMRTQRISPDEHDRRLAEISHLPHALAAVLVRMQEEASLPLLGKGFLDATRIAAGDGALWRDIFLDNRDNMLDAIAKARAGIDEIESLLTPERSDDLKAWLDEVAERRGKM